MKQNDRLIIALIIIFMVVGFFVQNAQQAECNNSANPATCQQQP